MRPARFALSRPTSVAAAVAELCETPDAKVIAGGQSLVPLLNLRMVAADKLIDIGRIAALRGGVQDGDAVRLGACVTHDDIQAGAVPDPSNGLMPYVAARIAYQAVRNRGTFGGSLALADPAADWTTTAATLGATIVFEGPDGEKTCPADEFVVGPYTTVLEPADLLTAVRIPRLHPKAAWGTYKLCRKVGEFAHAMATVIRQPSGARAFLGATDGAPIRLAHVCETVVGLRSWNRSHQRPLSEAFDVDLRNAGRVTDDVFAWQSRTCLIRAVAMSFGIREPRLEAA